MLVILVKTIKFLNFDRKEIVIPADTEVYVDQTESIAYASGYHFDISRDEYTMLQ
jgi:hypothetical protein